MERRDGDQDRDGGADDIHWARAVVVGALGALVVWVLLVAVFSM